MMRMMKKIFFFKCIVLFILFGSISLAQYKPVEVSGTKDIQADFFEKIIEFKDTYKTRLLEYNKAIKEDEFSKNKEKIIEIHIFTDVIVLFVSINKQINTLFKKSHLTYKKEQNDNFSSCTATSSNNDIGTADDSDLPNASIDDYILQLIFIAVVIGFYYMRNKLKAKI